MKAYLTIGLLVLSNIFMTLAWYGHLKMKQWSNFSQWSLFSFILFSWGLAFFEYCAQVPANKIGFIDNGGPFSFFQLKIIQEVITLFVFIIFAVWIFQFEKFRLNYLISFCFILGAVYFAFKK